MWTDLTEIAQKWKTAGRSEKTLCQAESNKYEQLSSWRVSGIGSERVKISMPLAVSAVLHRTREGERAEQAAGNRGEQAKRSGNFGGTPKLHALFMTEETDKGGYFNAGIIWAELCSPKEQT